jgi:ATP-dependent exoDNAse (exonuclease V) beta subunit
VKKISFSGMQIWKECPLRYKIQFLDRIPRKENIYAGFGSACHEVAEFATQNPDTCGDLGAHFKNVFQKEIKSLISLGIVFDIEQKKEIIEMFEEGKDIMNMLIPEMEEYFGEYEILETEFRLEVPLEQDIFEEEVIFKGFIDLIIYSKKLKKIIIIDYKTSTKGWHPYKKSDPLTNYQLALYKHFFAKEMKEKVEDIETYFILLKRKAKKKKIEFVKVSTGKRKTNNALKLLEKCMANVKLENWIKNRSSCKFCPYDNTKYCVK